MSDHPERPQTDRRARPRLSEQIQVIRELWLLREQARVQAAERCFLTQLERILTARLPHSSFSLSDDPPPIPPSHHHNPVRSPVPDPPPPLPDHHVSSYTTATFLADGPVYESNPPPRDVHSAPARERPGLVSEEVQQLRSRQRVTNLSPEFRAILEGNTPPSTTTTLARSTSFGHLSNQRPVSNALDSEFRHHLEGMLVRRGSSPPSSQTRHLYRSGNYTDPHQQHPHPPFQDHIPVQHPSPALEPVIQALREEVNLLKNVITASFDLQLDIQRSIRQEVSAAINSPVQLSVQPQRVQETSICTAEPSSHTRPIHPGLPSEKSSNPVAAGTCTVCLEAHIDSLLYGCGHMCTCARCGRQLIAIGQPCPICRAPVRDVVRAFMVTE